MKLPTPRTDQINHHLDHLDPNLPLWDIVTHPPQETSLIMKVIRLPLGIMSYIIQIIPILSALPGRSR